MRKLKVFTRLLALKQFEDLFAMFKRAKFENFMTFLAATKSLKRAKVFDFNHEGTGKSYMLNDRNNAHGILKLTTL